MAKWFSITARAGVGNIAIYDESGIGGISAASFANELKALGNVNLIHLSINSPGGDVFAGLTIHNLLARHPAKVRVTVDGIAASIASLIAMAGDEVVMPDNAMMMIHDPAGIVVGGADDMRDLAEALDKIKTSMAGTYAAKSGLPRERVEQIMADETWLTAHEAVDLGFADRVEKPVAIAARFDLKGRYAKAPDTAAATTIDQAAFRNALMQKMAAWMDQHPRWHEPLGRVSGAAWAKMFNSYWNDAQSGRLRPDLMRDPAVARH
jgi:ATP-dependent Clp protease, protease subunit